MVVDIDRLAVRVRRTPAPAGGEAVQAAPGDRHGSSSSGSFESRSADTGRSDGVESYRGMNQARRFMRKLGVLHEVEHAESNVESRGSFQSARRRRPAAIMGSTIAIVAGAGMVAGASAVPKTHASAEPSVSRRSPNPIMDSVHGPPASPVQ